MGAAAGGAASGGGIGATLGGLAALALAPGTGGASLAALAAGGGIGGAIGATTGYGMQHSAQAATNAAHASENAQQINQQNAAGLQERLLQAPRNITPDNFLASKAKQLANLRLGIGSTISGSSPTMSGADPSKKKLLGQ